MSDKCVKSYSVQAYRLSNIDLTLQMKQRISLVLSRLDKGAVKYSCTVGNWIEKTYCRD